MTARIVLVVLIVLLIGGGLFLLFKKGDTRLGFTPSGDSSQKLIKVRTTLAKSTPSEPQMLIIKKYGLDKKNGLDIEMVDSNPGDAEREFFAGNFDIILNGALSSFTANLKNIPIRIAAPAINQPFNVIVPKNSPIKTLSDLKNKKLATLPKITASYMSTLTVFRSAGIDPEKDMQMVFVTPDQVVGLLEKGEVDAGIVVSPLVYGILTNGKYRSIADLEKVWEQKEGLPMPFVVVAVNDNWYKDNKETTKMFIKTFYDAAEMIQKDPTVLASLTDYLKTNHLDSKDTIDLMQKEYPALLYSKWDVKGNEGLERFYERGKEYGVIPNNVPASDLVIINPDELKY